MLSTMMYVFVAALAGLALIGLAADNLAPRNKKITPGLHLLPGDISWQNQSGNVRVYFPIASSIVLSIAVSLVFWLFGRFF
jgi:Protein of unknown function (DUF2905)